MAGSGSFHVVCASRAWAGSSPCSGVWSGFAVGCGVSGAGSGLRVGWCAAMGRGGGVGTFLLVLAKFWRGAGRLAIVIWGLDTFLIFPNFVSRSATR